MQNADYVLEAQDLAVRYGYFHAVQSVSLRLARGQVVALLGANGAGKSTTLRALSGEQRAASGRILLHGQDATGWSTRRRLAQGVVLVPENRAVFGGLTVLENLRLGSYGRPFSRQLRQEIARILEYFPVLRDCLRMRANGLSGGEEQSLALARALLMRPKILLLDEPSHGLSPVATAAMFKLLATLAEHDGITMLIVEQHVRPALAIASYAYVIEAGMQALQGPPDLLVKHPRMRQAYLGGE